MRIQVSPTAVPGRKPALVQLEAPGTVQVIASEGPSVPPRAVDAERARPDLWRIRVYGPSPPPAGETLTLHLHVEVAGEVAGKTVRITLVDAGAIVGLVAPLIDPDEADAPALQADHDEPDPAA